MVGKNKGNFMSVYTEKERMIREKRTIEATRKNMIGATGKLG
jgi:hypothetical protein